jgi:hypothetical protein
MSAGSYPTPTVIGAWPGSTEMPLPATRPPVASTITTWATAAGLSEVLSFFVIVTTSVAGAGGRRARATVTPVSGPPVITGTGAVLRRTASPSTTDA